MPGGAAGGDGSGTGGGASSSVSGHKRKLSEMRRTCAGETWIDPTLSEWPESEWWSWSLAWWWCCACCCVLLSLMRSSCLVLLPVVASCLLPADDTRLFVGDLGNEVTDAMLAAAFRRFHSFAKAKVVRESKSHKR